MRVGAAGVALLVAATVAPAAEPSKAAANAKKLLTQDNAVLLVNASLSFTNACH